MTEPLPAFFFHIVSDCLQTHQGNILIGRTDEEGINTTRTSADGVAGLAGRFLRMVPALGGVRVIRSYAGVRPMPADGLPILGSVRGVEGLLVAVMHSGITLAPVTGELVSDLALTGRTAWPVEEFSPSRFDQMRFKFPLYTYRRLSRSDASAAPREV